MKLLDDDKIIDLSELFKIFGDSTRIKIINILLDEELCVGDIAEKISATQSAVSHQLRILKSSKLVPSNTYFILCLAAISFTILNTSFLQ